jgi:hypothetical protein
MNIMSTTVLYNGSRNILLLYLIADNLIDKVQLANYMNVTQFLIILFWRYCGAAMWRFQYIDRDHLEKQKQAKRE